MSVWYNEIEGYAADWLERLAAGGAIPGGVVDRRSIRRATPSGRRICALRASALRTAGNGSTSWPTPTKAELGNTPEQYAAMKRNMKSGPRTAVTHLNIAAQGWATPQAHDGKGSPNRLDKIKSGDSLPRQVAAWPTTTTTTMDARSSRHQGYMVEGNPGTTLTDAALLAGGLSSGSPAATREGSSTARLNPDLSRWLMGFPAVWAKCAPTETRSSRKSQPSSSERSSKAKGDMNLKKNRKAGVCIAMRCKNPSVEGSNFCARPDHAPPANENVLGDTLDALAPVEIEEAAEIGAALAQETKEATEAYALAESFVITTQDELAFAAEIVQDAKGNYNRLEEQKQEILRPLTESVKRIRDLFRPAQEYYSAIEGAIKKKIADAHRAQAENNAKALAAAQAQVDAGAEPVALAQVQHIGNVEGLQVRQVWDFEVVDEDAVDRLLMSYDVQKIRAFMRECVEAGAVPETAGVRFFQKDVVASRAR